MAANIDKAFYARILQDSFPQAFSVRFWDGEEREFGTGKRQFRMIFNQPLKKRAFLENPELAFAEAYMNQIIDLEGDLGAVLFMLLDQERSFLRDNTLYASAAARMASMRRNRTNIRHHYDIGNDFFRLWLDETMSYSCAYFDRPDATLAQAQRAKVAHVLRKLRLAPGQTLLDIGCGWGELIVSAARDWGVQALGITLSEEQAAAVRERIAREGLSGRVDVALLDFRELNGRSFDRVVSVGMAEHLGKQGIAPYFARLAEFLEPGGLSLLHCITRMRGRDVDDWTEKYIFPGGYIPLLSELVTGLADHGFNLLDLESLRPHYARTLELWLTNFEQELPRIRALKDESFIRMWRLYLASSAAGFRAGNLDVHQLAFVRGRNDSLPWTRDWLYKSDM